MLLDQYAHVLHDKLQRVGLRPEFDFGLVGDTPVLVGRGLELDRGDGPAGARYGPRLDSTLRVEEVIVDVAARDDSKLFENLILGHVQPIDAGALSGGDGGGDLRFSQVFVTCLRCRSRGIPCPYRSLGRVQVDQILIDESLLFWGQWHSGSPTALSLQALPRCNIRYSFEHRVGS